MEKCTKQLYHPLALNAVPTAQGWIINIVVQADEENTAHMS